MVVHPTLSHRKDRHATVTSHNGRQLRIQPRASRVHVDASTCHLAILEVGLAQHQRGASIVLQGRRQRASCGPKEIELSIDFRPATIS